MAILKRVRNPPLAPPRRGIEKVPSLEGIKGLSKISKAIFTF